MNLYHGIFLCSKLYCRKLSRHIRKHILKDLNFQNERFYLLELEF